MSSLVDFLYSEILPFLFCRKPALVWDQQKRLDPSGARVGNVTRIRCTMETRRPRGTCTKSCLARLVPRIHDTIAVTLQQYEGVGPTALEAITAYSSQPFPTIFCVQGPLLALYSTKTQPLFTVNNDEGKPWSSKDDQPLSHNSEDDYIN